MRVILKEHFTALVNYFNCGTWQTIIQSQCFLKTKDSQFFFCKQTSEIQGSTMQLLKTLKLFEPTWPLRKHPSDSWMLLIHLQKTWESFGFKKPLWLDNLLLSSPGSCTVSKQPVREIKKISLHAQFFHNYITYYIKIPTCLHVLVHATIP